MSLFNMGLPVSDLPILLQIVFLLGLAGWVAVLIMPRESRNIFHRRRGATRGFTSRSV